MLTFAGLTRLGLGCGGEHSRGDQLLVLLFLLLGLGIREETRRRIAYHLSYQKTWSERGEGTIREVEEGGAYLEGHRQVEVAIERQKEGR